MSKAQPSRKINNEPYRTTWPLVLGSCGNSHSTAIARGKRAGRAVATLGHKNPDCRKLHKRHAYKSLGGHWWAKYAVRGLRHYCLADVSVTPKKPADKTGRKGATAV